MKYLVVTAVGLLIAGCAAQSKPKASAAASDDPRQRAAFHAGVLEGWRQLPGIWLAECNKIDPAQAQARTEAYQQWAAKNQDELVRAETASSQAAERLLPSVKERGADPARYFQAQATFELFSSVRFDGKKNEKCATYPAQDFLDPASTAAKRAEAFAYLDKWLTTKQ